MTLDEWVKKGNPMLSNYTAAWCCQILQQPQKNLRKMELEDIYQIPGAGNIARREHESWIKKKQEEKAGRYSL